MSTHVLSFSHQKLWILNYSFQFLLLISPSPSTDKRLRFFLDLFALRHPVCVCSSVSHIKYCTCGTILYRINITMSLPFVFPLFYHCRRDHTDIKFQCQFYMEYRFGLRYKNDQFSWFNACFIWWLKRNSRMGKCRVINLNIFSIGSKWR